MAGRPPKVEHVKNTFLKEVKAAETLFEKINNSSGGKGVTGLRSKQVSQVIALAFMGVVASWEEFLEMALVRYVAGAKTSAGYAPTPKFGCATSLKHAYQVLSNKPDFNPDKEYLKVSDPKWVISLANFIFREHCFEDIDSKSELLKMASAIRNRVAHKSDKCRNDFRKAAIEFIGPKSWKQGYAVGDLLRKKVTRKFEQSVIRSEKTHGGFKPEAQHLPSDKVRRCPHAQHTANSSLKSV